jgi:hypothetical protein
MASVSVVWSHWVWPDVFEASSMALSKEEDTGFEGSFLSPLLDDKPTVKMRAPYTQNEERLSSI